MITHYKQKYHSICRTPKELCNFDILSEKQNIRVLDDGLRVRPKVTNTSINLSHDHHKNLGQSMFLRDRCDKKRLK